MKKNIYIMPACEIVNVRLTSGVLEGETNAGFNNNASTVGDMGGTPAKEESSFFEEEPLPTQPNIWAVDDEE